MRHFRCICEMDGSTAADGSVDCLRQDKTTTTEGSAITGAPGARPRPLRPPGAEGILVHGPWGLERAERQPRLVRGADPLGRQRRRDAADQRSRKHQRKLAFRHHPDLGGQHHGEASNPQKGTAGAPEINILVDEVLAAYYLWNEEYRALDRDLSLPYNGSTTTSSTIR